MIIVPKFVKDPSEGKVDVELYEKLWRGIIENGGGKGVGPLISEVLEDPGEFGINRGVRKEIIAITLNSLKRIGFYGSKVDIKVQSRFFRVIRSTFDDGGSF